MKRMMTDRERERSNLEMSEVGTLDEIINYLNLLRIELQEEGLLGSDKNLFRISFVEPTYNYDDSPGEIIGVDYYDYCSMVNELSDLRKQLGLMKIIDPVMIEEENREDVDEMSRRINEFYAELFPEGEEN